MITSQEVAILKTNEELYRALWHRHGICCHVYAHEDINLLNFLIRQKYPAYFYQNNGYPHSPMSLPTSSAYYALRTPEIVTATKGSDITCCVPLQSSLAIGDNSIWGISALNGFYICQNVVELINALADPSFLVAPWAISYPTPVSAWMEAQNNYVERFFRHFNTLEDRINLPAKLDMAKFPGYLDPAFDEREKRWIENNSFELFHDLYRLGF